MLDFEKTFSSFLENKVYDNADNAIFLLVRAAYLAGWKAAGGEEPQEDKIINIFHQVAQSKGM